MGLTIALIVIVLVVLLVAFMNRDRFSSRASYERSAGAAVDAGMTNVSHARGYDAPTEAPTDVVGAGAVDGGGAKYNESDALIGGIASNVQPEVSAGDDRPSYEKNN